MSANGDAVVPEDLHFLEAVGEGAYGEVRKAEWGTTIVAIKKVTANGELKRIKNEADILSNVRHPNIVSIYGSCSMPNELWIVMEFMEGGNLYDFLHSDIEIGWSFRLRLMCQAARALDALHSHDPCILHRDVKSVNFLLSKDNAVLKLCDFGFSKFSSTISSVQREAIGTTRWRAPETFVYPHSWTPKSDVYSIGITFYEIISRKLPFEDEHNEQIIIHFIKTGSRPSLPNCCSQNLAQIIRQCWDHSEDTRLTARQLLIEVEKEYKLFCSINPTPEIITFPSSTPSHVISASSLEHGSSPLPSPSFPLLPFQLPPAPSPPVDGPVQHVIQYQEQISRYSRQNCFLHKSSYHDFFINYRVSSEGAATIGAPVKTIFETLSALNKRISKEPVLVFWDVKCLNIGQNWERGIIQGLAHSKVILLLVSTKALEGIKQNATSQQYNLLVEYEIAILQNKLKNTAVIPVFIAGAEIDANGNASFSSFDFNDMDPKKFPQQTHARNRDVQHIINDLQSGLPQHETEFLGSISNTIDQIRKLQGYYCLHKRGTDKQELDQFVDRIMRALEN